MSKTLIKTDYKLRSMALIYPYTKIGKGGTEISVSKLVKNFSPLKRNDKKVMAEIRMIQLYFNPHLNN